MSLKEIYNYVVAQLKGAAGDLNTGADDAKYATSLALQNSKYLTQSGVKDFVVASGTNTYTATVAPAITAISTGQRITVQFSNASTSATPTINLNSIGAKTITKRNGVALVTGDIAAGQIYTLIYDGTNFRILGIANTATFNDVILINQAATIGTRNQASIDDTGQLRKTSWAVVDETNRKTTKTGKDNLIVTTLEEWLNSDGASIMKILNGFQVQFGGTTAFFTVPSSITAGNAGIVFRDITGVSYRIKDDSSNDFTTFEKLTDGRRIMRFRRPTVRDHSIGLAVFQLQEQIVTSITNSAQNTIVTIAVPTDNSLVVNIRVAQAYATDGSLVTRDPFTFSAKNSAGTLTTDTSGTAVHRPLPNTLTGNFNLTTSGTNVIIRFQNEAAGKTYTVVMDYEVVLTPIPVL